MKNLKKIFGITSSFVVIMLAVIAINSSNFFVAENYDLAEISFIVIALAAILVNPTKVFAAEKYERRAGILLHPTSLPSKFGIGDLGKEAFEFIDYLKSEGQTIWQMLPLNPVGYGNSPYQSPSAFAGNPMLISPADLVERGLLTEDDIKLPATPFRENRIEFERAWSFKSALLKKAFKNFKAKLSSDKKLKAAFEKFRKDESYWLDDYEFFAAIKNKNNGAYWVEWDDKIKKRDAATLKKLRQDLADDILYVDFEQYIFDVQWKKIRKYANENGVQIMGDMPIFVSADSADVWANPELFQLKEDGRPLKVAGNPPDYFSKTGQLWGNPHYNWDAMKAKKFSWWKLRFKKLFELTDIVRIDHFSGFDSDWSIDGDAPTAVDGEWIQVPGKDLFKNLKKEFGRNKPMVAEDLGVMTDEAKALRKEYGFPGMYVLQFKIAELINDKKTEFVAAKDSVTYPGTHDNNTSVGWFIEEVKSDMKVKIAKFLGANVKNPKDVCQKMIELSYASESCFAIIPMQDVLKLDSSAKMNRPGTVGDNWSWQLTADYLSKVERGMLKALCNKYSR